MLVACRPPAATISFTNETKEKDSTRIEWKDREVEVYLPGQTVIVHDTIECDKATNKPKPKTIMGKSKNAITKTVIDKKGAITSQGGCDSAMVKVKVKEKEAHYWKTMFQKQREKKETPVYITRKIDWICRLIATCAIMYILFKLKNKFL